MNQNKYVPYSAKDISKNVKIICITIIKIIIPVSISIFLKNGVIYNYKYFIITIILYYNLHIQMVSLLP